MNHGIALSGRREAQPPREAGNLSAQSIRRSRTQKKAISRLPLLLLSHFIDEMSLVRHTYLMSDPDLLKSNNPLPTGRKWNQEPRA